MQRPEPATIPQSPGVYLYKDERGRVIYVGKARNLRKRVLSYFRPTGLPAKTVAMLAKAVSIDYIATTTEKEALLLEASLIKRHRPHYNIVLRDDKQYALFRLNVKQDFPRLEITRRTRRDGAKYFGPFTSSLAARETWKLIHRAFPLRRCADRAMKNRIRPCLYYHMGQCQAPCMGLVDKKDYKKSVQEVSDLLSGNSAQLLDKMRREMDLAADDLDYEQAARLRDQIRAVEKTVEKQAAILPGVKDVDAIDIYPAKKGMALGIVFVRNGAVSDGRAFYWPGLKNEDASELLATFLGQFYSQAQPPPRILLPWKPDHQADPDDNADNSEDDFWDNLQTLEQALSERRNGAVRLVTAKDASDTQLLDIARTNAIEEARRKQNQDASLILENLGKILGLKKTPRRIECVDVSHISGRQTRVGMVVYEDGVPKKDDYRVYAMPDSSDDYATLHAWVARRLESGEPWPDLLLVDGGKGQIASVEKAFVDAGKTGLIPIAGIAKARDEYGRADRRAGNVADRIFIPGRSNPLSFRAASPELLLLQQIRDSTHQFAISSHRKARRSAAFSGELMRLPGVGAATARLLWDKFGSLEAMRKATKPELMNVPGIGDKRAEMLIAKLKDL